jgi:hypothetical protein
VSLWDKFEKIFTAISFAEKGLSDEARQSLEEESQASSLNSTFSLKGANIWFGVVRLED